MVSTYQAIPQMNTNYEAWIPPNVGVWFIGDEYSHRIIEKVAGLNSQTTYKWFDEGLAEHAGLRTWAVQLTARGGTNQTKWMEPGKNRGSVREMDLSPGPDHRIPVDGPDVHSE